MTYDPCLKHAATSIFFEPVESDRFYLFCLCFMLDGEDGVAEDDGGDSLLLTLFFLLYHICHHSFLKSCYLKKCFNFCVLSLFCFFKAFKMGRSSDICCRPAVTDVTYLRSEGAVRPPASRGRHAEMHRPVNEAWQPMGTPVLWLSWDFDVLSITFLVSCCLDEEQLTMKTARHVRHLSFT